MDLYRPAGAEGRGERIDSGRLHVRLLYVVPSGLNRNDE
jgi:hypothetical protein